jgi:cell division protein FtsB
MQIKTKLQTLATDNAHKLTDIRFVGQIVFVVIVLLISWSGVKSIQTNYGLQKQITGLKQQNELQRLKNENLNLQNDYYNTDQYLEVAARQNFGLAAPGETVLIVPKSVALANTVDTTPNQDETAQAKQPSYQRNFQSWVDFFLHRQNTTQ